MMMMIRVSATIARNVPKILLLLTPQDTLRAILNDTLKHDEYT